MLKEQYSFKLYYSNSPVQAQVSFTPDILQFRRSFEHLNKDSNPLSFLVAFKKCAQAW